MGEVFRRYSNLTIAQPAFDRYLLITSTVTPYSVIAYVIEANQVDRRALSHCSRHTGPKGVIWMESVAQQGKANRHVHESGKSMSDIVGVEI